MTGYPSAEMDLRTDPEQASTVLTLTTANSRIALGGTAGTVTLTLTATETNSLTAGDGYYDLEITNSAGFVTRLLEGTYSVRRNVSR